MKKEQYEVLRRVLTTRQVWILQRLEKGVPIRRVAIPGLLLWADGRVENESEIDELVRLKLVVVEV